MRFGYDLLKPEPDEISHNRSVGATLMADPKGYYSLTIVKYWKGGLFLFRESNVDRFFRLQPGGLESWICLVGPSGAGDCGFCGKPQSGVLGLGVGVVQAVA